MYASIRRYKTKSANEVLQHVREGFVPIISKAPGFISYTGIDTGDGVIASISVFETKAQVDESNRLAADWVKKTVAHLVEKPEITEGEVAVYKAK
jgi:hypothetical protein